MAGLFLGITALQLTPHEILSGIFGSISLAAWIFLLVVWFIGDIANFFGAIWAGLVPTVIALAVYFCFADLMLITQCLYYNFINSHKAGRKQSITTDQADPDSPEQPLLGRRNSDSTGLPGSHRRSSASHRRRSSQVSNLQRDTLPKILEEESRKKAWIKNTVSILLVCAAGAAGWAIAWKTGVWAPTPEEIDGGSERIARGPQILGYLSAICYLG
ncbi:MAG: hypothetical protein M1830_008160 [Pleopsidium flavum]|nr:MAG: hypothetical protein M1830_008160 [Pleopsidium flavum]